MSSVDLVVIGGGQAGLATAHTALGLGLRPLVLDAGPGPGGSWPSYYDSLTLFSPARSSSLPGFGFPGDPDRYPLRDEVVDYLAAYTNRLQAEVRFANTVAQVLPGDGGFSVTTMDGTTVSSPAVVAATGGFGAPYRPSLPGLDNFTGTVLHAAQYRDPAPFAGSRVLVVGGGNSAVQIAVELATVAKVSLTTRGPLRFQPQRYLGRDFHWWLTRTGLDSSRLGPRLAKGSVPVIDDGRYRTAIRAGRPDHRPLFARLDGDRVVWPDGTSERGRRGAAGHRLPASSALPGQWRGAGRLWCADAHRWRVDRRTGSGFRGSGAAAQLRLGHLARCRPRRGPRPHRPATPPARGAGHGPPVSTVAVAARLVASMLAIGTALTVEDSRTLGRRPAVFAAAVGLNVIVVPGLAVALTRLVDLGPQASLGIVLAAAAPGGGTGALLTLYARGDLAVSAALRGVHAPLGLLSVPVWAAVAGHDLLPTGTAGLWLIGVALVGQLVPLATGMWLLRRRPKSARRVHRAARRVADVLLAVLVAYFVVTGCSRLPQLGWETVAVIAVLVAACLALVFLPWPGPAGVRRAVAMTTTVRNLSLALFVASTASATVVLTLLAYGLLMYGFSVPVAWRLARRTPSAATP
ncbi:NAD(P)-binding domain-containing protein [Actinoplanes sp. NPDC051470]|uniref:NAD(P)-binding domain-containing protein n=1 Tax=Actinoplanes sp. NPDC051470 TaxID=3157224 RepID=UPI0034196FD8